MGQELAGMRTFEVTANGQFIEVKPDGLWVSVQAIAFVKVDKAPIVDKSATDKGEVVVRLRLFDNSTSHKGSGMVEGVGQSAGIETLVSRPMLAAEAEAFLKRLTGDTVKLPTHA